MRRSERRQQRSHELLGVQRVACDLDAIEDAAEEADGDAPEAVTVTRAVRDNRLTSAQLASLGSVAVRRTAAHVHSAFGRSTRTLAYFTTSTSIFCCPFPCSPAPLRASAAGPGPEV